MTFIYRKTKFLIFLLCFPYIIYAQSAKVLTNHVGYEKDKPKKAVIMAESKLPIETFDLVDAETGKTVYSGKIEFSGPVAQWKNWQFWMVDFSDFTKEGNYQLQVSYQGKTVSSYPFAIDEKVLEQSTLSNVIYYFKGQRATGLFNEADHHLPLGSESHTDTIDAHGGWYDATGDYGKHLSHLSFSTYFNPQQISLTVWAMLKTYELLNQKPGTDFRQYKRRLLDEAMYGADYLARIQTGNGSFYRSVGAPGPGKLAKDRSIQPEHGGYSIKKSKDESFDRKNKEENDLLSYQASYRSGGGLAIAALAMASTYDTTGDYTNAEYLKAAENAFAFLEKNNAQLTNDGKENMLDDYCALSAATELFKATKKEMYKQAAEKRAVNLMNRLGSWKKEKDYWRVNDQDRPFFHPSDAGLPVISLIYYYPLANAAIRQKIKEVIKRSMQHELAITNEVNNPFGYSRQLVQDTLGNRRTSFFFPHRSEAAPWWQGENARLGSMAAAARLSADVFTDDQSFRDSLNSFAIDQLNWILGLNPYDACMLQGNGHHNPQYAFFGTFEYTNAPGGIVNGITGGMENEADIDFNLSYEKTGMDNDWRWVEQWLPHAAWYLLAISIND